MSNFTFTQISDSSGPYIGVAAASINNAGTVVYEGFQTTQFGPTPAAILSGTGNGPPTTIVDTSQGYDIFYSPTINSAGETVFAAAGFQQGQTGVSTSSGGTLKTVAYNNGPFTVGTNGYTSGNFVSAPGINDRGTVVNLAGQNGETGIYATTTDSITTDIADSTGRFSNFYVGFDVGRGSGPFSIYTLPAINDGGTVAFNASLDAGGSGIFTGDGLEISTIADTSGIFSYFSSPTINDGGTVAFNAGLDTGGSGIFTSNVQEISTIADTSGLFDSFLSDVAFNESGKVAFEANLDNGINGIFTSANPLTDQVIALGDRLGNSTVTDLDITRQGLNDSGQISFTATLADGTQAVYRADPTAVPEPSSSAFFALAVLCMAGYRWFSRKQAASNALRDN